ncbi:DUF2079 domain-containing protein [Streptacidiphilus sp. P02-A3a]|uniref:DUF2079 domain-containing protein n=1 Tax=Streptacidiphilus sp. P02-A3a TaxID=2704468 RepID=UPI0015FE7773|nr:DUF2079 domain-containing protein [Streptacidiphilus sp. P02-A3a]QMU70522.1 DUF2079 domain-containing protein [Streptacidiphilus sp. P02-A3a]
MIPLSKPSRGTRSLPARISTAARPPTAIANGAAAGRVPLPWVVAGIVFAVCAGVSVRLHQRMLTSGFDLGIFEQTVRSWAHGHLPVVDLKGPGFPELGDHFSPILATLAPFYRIWPSPYVLLVAQAALLAVAAVPLARWALRALGPAAAWTVGLSYGFSWGVASAVGFDFHEYAFAVPLVSFSLCALGQRGLRAAALWALPLLLVKEDLGLTVATIGLLIAYRGRRRWGLATACAGVAGTLVETLVVIPAFNPFGHYSYWRSMGGTSGGLPQSLYRATVGLVAAPEPKAVTLVLLFAPTAFLALRSPLAWAAVPTLLWRFASDNPMYWGTGYQYSAVLVPVVFAAFVDSLVRQPVDRRMLRHLLTVSATVTLLLLPQFPLFQLVQPRTWHTPERIATARAIMRLIPDGATVAASNQIVPQLTDRCTVTEFGVTGSPDPQWIMVDTAFVPGWPISGGQQADELAQARDHGYRTAADTGGYLLLHRV